MRVWPVVQGVRGRGRTARPGRIKVERPSWRRTALTATEIVLAVAAATGGVAALQSSTPVEGLGILYLLAQVGVLAWLVYREDPLLLAVIPAGLWLALMAFFACLPDSTRRSLDATRRSCRTTYGVPSPKPGTPAPGIRC